jgi:hypothetical protein
MKKMNLGKNKRKVPAGVGYHLYSLSFSTFAIFPVAERRSKKKPKYKQTHQEQSVNRCIPKTVMSESS